MIDYSDYFRKDGTQDRELIELINNYSAYQQGRADLLMPYDVESIDELIENVKSKARADAIDEFADFMLEKLPNNMDKTFTCGAIALLICGVAEQLKEQNNGMPKD